VAAVSTFQARQMHFEPVATNQTLQNSAVAFGALPVSLI